MTDPTQPLTSPDQDPLRSRVFLVFLLLNAGMAEQARDELALLAAELDDPRVTERTRGEYWDATGRLRLHEGRWDEAEPAFRRALELLRSAGAPAVKVACASDELAVGLRDNGRWLEAEPLFREALALKEQDGGSALSRGVTLHELAFGLRDNGRWPEAEPLFREAIRLQEHDDETPSNRACTLREFARGLRENGDPDEAAALEAQAHALDPT